MTERVKVAPSNIESRFSSLRRAALDLRSRVPEARNRSIEQTESLFDIGWCYFDQEEEYPALAWH
eukprot:9256413-Pyramimonas_sp.AAC.1